jgi:hypothetical protein
VQLETGVARNARSKGTEMSLKLKAFGIGLLATMAIAAGGAMNASAEAGGHFVLEKAHSHIKSSNNETHQWHLALHGLSGEVGCDLTLVTATAVSQTLESIGFVPNYDKCTTTGSETAIQIAYEGCHSTYTVAKGTGGLTEQTVHLLCPAGKAIRIMHPNCTISINPQTATGGLTYTNKTDPTTGKHEVTLEAQVQHSITRHGLCQFVAPTNGTATTNGSLTFKAFDAEGSQINFTAT